jgi:hypothetical protein
MFHTEDPKILFASVRDAFAWVTCTRVLFIPATDVFFMMICMGGNMVQV